MVYRNKNVLRIYMLILSGTIFYVNGENVRLLPQDHPVYRRIELKSQLRSSNLPTTLEFHVLNNETWGNRLYENSGDYGNPDNQSDPFGDCGGRIYNTDEKTGDFKRDSLGNVLSFLGINNNAQYGGTTNYAFYLDTAYINRGTGWIKPQYMLAVDPYSPDECELCNPETGESEMQNAPYLIGRYLYNTTMYAKPVVDSMMLADGSWAFADKYYDAEKGEGIRTSENSVASGYLYRRKNFSKAQPIKDQGTRNPNGEVYKYNREWERLAFAWAIHKGDSLYVLKGEGLEPMYKRAVDDPHQLWLTLTKEYGEEGKYVDFTKLINENIVPGSTYQEAYYPRGDRSAYPEMRTYYDFKPASALSPGKTIGVHAIIALDDNTHKDWVFSFRLIEKGADDFVIESEASERNIVAGAMIRPGYGGWIKFQNGVPVISRSDENDLMGEACVFNVKQINNPVNNEAVNDDASSEIKIVAGTKNVTVLNAAGKRLILRNILGQVIMNTIIVSNNESIPAPSGMLIITVENENSFKTIVK